MRYISIFNTSVVPAAPRLEIIKLLDNRAASMYDRKRKWEPEVRKTLIRPKKFVVGLLVNILLS